MNTVCYIFVLCTFRTKLRNNIFLGTVLSDVLFISATLLDTVEAQLLDVLCEGLGYATHFSFLLVQLCVVVLGVDNGVTF